jgi:hypothetical protein
MVFGRLGFLLVVAGIAWPLWPADAEKTSGRLLISGTRNIVKLGPSERILADGREVYAGRGWIELAVRGAVPSKVIAWERGLPEIDLFLEGDEAAKKQPCAATPRNFIDVPVKPNMRIKRLRL